MISLDLEELIITYRLMKANAVSSSGKKKKKVGMYWFNL